VREQRQSENLIVGQIVRNLPGLALALIATFMQASLAGPHPCGFGVGKMIVDDATIATNNSKAVGASLAHRHLTLDGIGAF